MQDRTRALTPLLPKLLAAAEEYRRLSSELLTAASTLTDGQAVTIGETRFVRDLPARTSDRHDLRNVWVSIPASAEWPRWLGRQGARINCTRMEEDGFYGWAIVETLRHTGIRIEELLELTQLSLRHYIPPTTGTVVPLLHIVPSKSDTERLIPMSPELVHVLLEVVRRAKSRQANIPMSIRYDPHEKLYGQALPHLFARGVGTRHEVLSMDYIRKTMQRLAQIAGLTDGERPVAFTPHDFRRLFATDLVNTGLPLHIVATLMGHLNLDTTRGYTAVFPEHVITAHNAFIERRRTLRPSGENRRAEPDEWVDFEEHFLLRKVALGECHRPYGTACVHEHACARCRFLRVDPTQLPRIQDMTINTELRLAEAREHTWLGEVAALEDSLLHLHRRAQEAQQMTATP